MNLLVVGLLGWAACGRSEPTTRPTTTTTPTPLRATDAAPAPVIPATAQQLITGIVADWTATTTELRLWQRDGQHWRPVGEPWHAVIGRSGTAWGSGLHGHGAPSGDGGPVKREGDGKSPAGAFAINASYGYAAAPPGSAPRTTAQLRYTAVDDNWQCVDDPASKQYARILDRRTVAIDWTSAEQMKRPDPLYTWVVDIAHNPARTPGDGSCIFFHVWHGPDSTTVGCTAMPEERLESLVAALDPSAVYVLLPKGAYDALAGPWNLPRQ